MEVGLFVGANVGLPVVGLLLGDQVVGLFVGSQVEGFLVGRRVVLLIGVRIPGQVPNILVSDPPNAPPEATAIPSTRIVYEPAP